jgi:hypothetical protein
MPTNLNLNLELFENVQDLGGWSYFIVVNFGHVGVGNAIVQMNPHHYFSVLKKCINFWRLEKF